ncbi:MAG: hypothetical protein QM755_02985 [Luteolibacter sp.]
MADVVEYYMGSSMTGMRKGVAAGNGTFTAEFTRQKGVADVTGELQWSTDLSHWYASGQSNGARTVQITTQTVSPATDDPETLKATATVTAGSATAPLFLRLVYALEMRFLPSSLLCLLLVGPLHAHPDPSHTWAELEQHLAESPDDPALLQQKAELLLLTLDTALAKQVAIHALQQAPEDPAIQLLQCKVAEAMGHRSEAITGAAEIRPPFSPPSGVLGLPRRPVSESLAHR